MSMLSDTMTLAKREMLIFRANIRTNAIRSAIFPLFIILLFSSIGSNVTNVPIAVINYANNVQSNQFVTALQSQNLMHVVSISQESQAFQLLDSGQITFVVVILPNFPSRSQTPSVQVYYSNIQQSTTAGILPVIQQRVTQFTSPGQFQSIEYLPTSSGFGVITTPVNAASGNYQDFLFSGVIGMIIFFSALFGGGLGLINDRQSGSIKQFLITPIDKSAILISRVVAGAVQSLFSIAIVLAIGLLLGSHIAMGIFGLIWIAILGMLLAIVFYSISAILAVRLRNLAAFTIIGQAVGMPAWFLSGGLIPTSSMAPILQTLSLVDPMTYALDGFRYVVLVGTYPLSNIITDVSVLGVFAIIFTALSIYMFKSTIE